MKKKVIRLNEQDIENLVTKIIKEDFDSERYQETEDEARDRLINYLEELTKTIPQLGERHSNVINDIIGLADSYADDMWREGARGGFAR